MIGPPACHKIPALSVLHSTFLHGSWLRLLGNMLFLWVFGNNVEDRLGRVRYLLFYLLAGYVAAYGFAVVNRDVARPLVGASGAVSAVLGAYLVLSPGHACGAWCRSCCSCRCGYPHGSYSDCGSCCNVRTRPGTPSRRLARLPISPHVLGFVFGVLAAIPFLRRRPPYPYRRQWTRPARRRQ